MVHRHGVGHEGEELPAPRFDWRRCLARPHSQLLGGDMVGDDEVAWHAPPYHLQPTSRGFRIRHNTARGRMVVIRPLA